MDAPIAAGGTIVRLYGKKSQADVAVARLRAAGFADVRVSEAAGTTTQAHVPVERGLAEDDFCATLTRAGFPVADAERLTRAVANGDVLVTVAAPERVDDALAVLRGENVGARHLGPVDVTPPAPQSVGFGRVEPTDTAGDGDRVIPLRAERLDVSTQKKTTEARVRREVVTEQRTVTIPVQHEELVIERDGAETVRIPVSGDATNA